MGSVSKSVREWEEWKRTGVWRRCQDPLYGCVTVGDVTPEILERLLQDAREGLKGD